MPVYSEVIDDDKIIELVQKNHLTDILLVGCSGCMNESLSFKKRLPLNKVKEGQKISYAILQEMERLRQLLELKSCVVSILCVPEGSNALCMIDSSKEEYIIMNKNVEYSAILALCCPAGVYGLKHASDCGKTFSIVRTKGTLSYKCQTDNNGERSIIYDESKAIKWDKGV